MPTPTFSRSSQNDNTIAVVLADGMQKLSQYGDAAAMEARALLRNRLQMSDAELLSRGEQKIAAATVHDYTADITRRVQGEPLAYIVGHREFMGWNFITTPAALIPRPETEELTETAIAHIPNKTKRVLDIGAGCGAIGLSIALARPQCEVALAEYEQTALALAKQNALVLGAQADFCRSNWYENIHGTFDLIVSNPPYIRDNHQALRTLKHEPMIALQGGSDGLRALAMVVQGAPKHLRSGGVLLVEHGHDQQQDTRKLFADVGFCGIRCLQDLSNLPRMTLGVWAG